MIALIVAYFSDLKMHFLQEEEEANPLQWVIALLLFLIEARFDLWLHNSERKACKATFQDEMSIKVHEGQRSMKDARLADCSKSN